MKIFKTTALFITLSIILFLWIYGMVAFFNWQTNPELWTETSRYILSLIGGAGMVVVAGMISCFYYQTLK